jgi:hypothetical protein
MFKEKASKKRLVTTNNAKDHSTLDVMHNKMIKTFALKSKEKNTDNALLDKMVNAQLSIKRAIDTLSSDVNTETEHYNNLWSSNIKLSEEIVNLKNKIRINSNKYNEMEYYKNTSDILFNYYDLLEKQSEIVNSTNHIVTKSSNKTILDALNNVSGIPLVKEESKESNPAVISNTEKTDLVDEYLFITNKHHVRKVNTDELESCKVCKNSMICLQHDALIICEQCGYQELLLVEQNRPILKQNTKDTSHFSYKRINHFREWCNQVQGKESTDIPNEVFEKILNEIKKEKIVDTKKITYAKMREILKRLRINKYYEHINYIINRINGMPTPQFSPDLEEKLYNMFRDIQGPFLKHCPKDRKNFLSYSYVLYKFFQILGLNEYLKYFPLLKSREKLYVQDQIWKKICEELNYEFIASPSL